MGNMDLDSLVSSAIDFIYNILAFQSIATFVDDIILAKCKKTVHCCGKREGEYRTIQCPIDSL